MSSKRAVTKYLLFSAITLVLVIIALNIEKHAPFLSYAFLARVPIGLGVLLAILPVLGLYVLPNMLKSMFSLGSARQVLWTVFLVLMNAQMVVLTSRTIILYADKRFEGLGTLMNDFSTGWWVMALFLSIPLMWGVCKTSVEISVTNRAKGVLMGTGLAWCFIFLSVRAIDSGIIPNYPELLIKAFNFLTRDAMRAGYFDANGHLYDGHTFSMTMVLFLLGFYILGYRRLTPAPDNPRRPPALFYVLILMLFSGYLFSYITFFLDLFRVPVMLTMFILIVIAYRYQKVDHYYRVFDSAHAPSEKDLGQDVRENLVQSLENRLTLFQGDKEERTLVVVSCMGGGIQASGWTTQVLAGLQEELGKEFSQAIGIISSVSGGSVGTMHFLDHFDNKSGALKPESLLPAPDAPLIKVAADSVAESLYATGWGLAYPDALRTVGLPFLVEKETDRGWAIEQAWKGNLNFPGTTLTQWRELVLQGEFPVPVFNATIVETGQRFMLTPLPFSWEGAADSTKVDFHARYPGRDVEVVSAARLSATFPYVTPVCRTNLSDDIPYAGRHIADGGYFDNFGVFTTLEWLKEVILPNYERLKIDRLLMIELNGFPEAEEDRGENRYNGFIASVAGPLMAIMNVRTSTQVARNDAEVASFFKQWENKLDMERVVVRFKADEPGKTPPLSWKLTWDQKEDIAQAWNILKNEKNGALSKIRAFWNRKSNP